MPCSSCGAQVGETAKFCPSCGAVQQAAPVITGQGQSQAMPFVGFSSRINHPAFATYLKHSSQWSVIFACILAVIALIGFPIYGNASGDIAFPASLLYGFGIGCLFIFIALGQILRKNKDKTYDGTVISKNIYRSAENNGGHIEHHTNYVIKVQNNKGKVKTHKWQDSPGLYSYYNQGDIVRHHKGFSYYEKYDKSQDAQILCAACLQLCDKRLDACPRCKCPLLK